MTATAQLRADIERIYHAALNAVNGRTAVARALREGGVADGPFYLVAVGKAATAMAHGLADERAADVVAALVVTRAGYEDPDLARRLPVQTITAPHPIPDARSLEAGEALVRFIEQTPADGRFVFLVSGGASSLIERLAPGMDAAALARLNRWLLASGLDIGRTNRLRKAFSTIKGGRLAQWIGERPADVLLISDVPGDAPATIGSGLLFVDDDPPLTAAELDALPAGLVPAPPAPPVQAPSVSAHVVARNAAAVEAAAEQARSQGFVVSCPDRFLDGEARALGADLAAALVNVPGCLHVWGGEPTVTLPREPGRGGRMQALALAAAQGLAGHPAVLLAAGTDGADGPGEDAGALVDGQTIIRGQRVGLDAERTLDDADSGRFLAASGDLIRTGGTGTNVMDLVIGYHGCKGTD
jgi:hydroxypyruvate reductase